MKAIHKNIILTVTHTIVIMPFIQTKNKQTVTHTTMIITVTRTTIVLTVTHTTTIKTVIYTTFMVAITHLKKYNELIIRQLKKIHSTIINTVI